MSEKLTRWTISLFNGKWLETMTQKPEGDYKYTWTRHPSMVLYCEEEITHKPINSKVVKVELQKYYKVVKNDFLPEIKEIGYQHFGGDDEFSSYEDAVNHAINMNKEKITEYKNLAKALTDWNKQYKQ